MILIPIVAAVCFLIGGQWWKPARWFMGLPIGLLATIGQVPWLWVLIFIGLSTGVYLIATNAFNYGEKSWLNPLGEWGKFFVCGAIFGACSFVFLVWWLALIQTIMSGLLWLVIKYLDDKNIVKNPWVELLRGFVGTIAYLWR